MPIVLWEFHNRLFFRKKSTTLAFFLKLSFYICSPKNKKINFARVAELVDAADSKSAVRKDVLVRFQSRALNGAFQRNFDKSRFHFLTKHL